MKSIASLVIHYKYDLAILLKLKNMFQNMVPGKNIRHSNLEAPGGLEILLF